MDPHDCIRCGDNPSATGDLCEDCQCELEEEGEHFGEWERELMFLLEADAYVPLPQRPRRNVTTVHLPPWDGDE